MKAQLLHKNNKKKLISKFKNYRFKTIFFCFDSKLEYKHFLLLKSREQKGEISHLKRQVRIKLGVAKECKVYYVADFVFYDNIDKIWVVADSKGVPTDTFKVKFKWLLDSYSSFRFDLIYNNKLESFYPYDEKNPELIKKNEKN